MNNLYHPEEMTNLKERLDGRVFNRCVKSFEEESSIKECDAIKKDGRGRKPVTTKNTIQPFICQHLTLASIPVDVMYVIEGVARLDWYSRGDAMRKNVVAPDPIIEHSFVKPWTRVLYKECDAIKEYRVKEGFTKPKPNLYGEWFLSPAGKTRKEYLINLNKTDNNVTALSVNTIVFILKRLAEISTKNIQGLLGIGKRQCERYNKACTLIMPYLHDAFKAYFEFRVGMLRERYRKICLQEKIEWTQEDEELFLQGVFDTDAVDSVGGGLSEYYNEGIAGVYVPFEGVSLEAYSAGDGVKFEDLDLDAYTLLRNV